MQWEWVFVVMLFVNVGPLFTFLTFYFGDVGYKSEDSSANDIDANSVDVNSADANSAGMISL